MATIRDEIHMSENSPLTMPNDPPATTNLGAPVGAATTPSTSADAQYNAEYNQAKRDANAAVNNAEAAVSDTANAAQAKATQAKDQAAAQANQVAGQAKDAANQAKDVTAQKVGQAQEKVSQVAGQAQQAAGEAANVAEAYASKAHAQVQGYASVAQEKAAQAAEIARQQAAYAQQRVADGAAVVQNDFAGITRNAQQADQQASTPLAKYNSFVYDLCSWNYPTASAFFLALGLSGLVLIKFVNIPKLVFRGAWIVFLISAIIEYAGKIVTGTGFVSTYVKPRTFLTIPREQLDPVFDECHALTNSILSEFQRLVFAENVAHTLVAFAFSFIFYQLFKIVSLWTLSLLTLIAAFSIPPFYARNKTHIDAQLNRLNAIGSKYTQQAQQVVGDYSHVAAEKARGVATVVGEKERGCC
ncbi:hypothetical protein SAICODRAFT_205363 [Saitoella complicata NRRL Y-17804]|uniref:uncharacterized protein n=1 Tax=Saitoella complicata (strain BCRC 22490 / CBS 7301 / JCM 7358 / NBRC 10748 / NRRL Y-17804) TaxID=698492 RepID=UPI0008670BCD|nr:uncharacterized protein SAICODRAFT_205363 [Saitoella complicata NRRL Y-17804]ODQ54751.1 hypothetical protein SAICODRAFT_205363 [Saitoella complicata NRRL Y-17804]